MEGAIWLLPIAGAALLSLGIGRRIGFFDRRPVEQPSLPGDTAFGFLLLFIVAELFFPHFLLHLFSPGWTQVFTLLLLLVLFAMALLLCGPTMRRAVSLPPTWKHEIKLGVVALLLAYPLMLFVNLSLQTSLEYMGYELLEDQVAVREVRYSLAEPRLAVALGALVVFAVPFIEELLFRGVLIGWMRGHLSHRWQLLISMTLFSLVHYSAEQGLSNVPLLGSLFVLSYFLGHIYLKSGSLLPSTTLHVLFNALNVGLILLHESGLVSGL